MAAQADKRTEMSGPRHAARATPAFPRYIRRTKPNMTRPIVLALPLLCLSSLEAGADGSFLQFDLGPETSDSVLATTRGKMSFGANYSTYDSGWSAGLHVTRDFVLESIATVKIGPSLGRSDDTDGWSLGGKVIVERYQPTDFGFMFLSAQYNTYQNDWFALAQFGNASGLSVDLTAGGSETYSEQAVAVNYRLDDEGPVRLRAGYRFDAQQVFVGLSVNTY